MKKAYIMLSIVVLVLFVSSYFLHFSDDSSDSIKPANSNFLTGFAAFNYDNLVVGDSDACFVYSDECPDNTTALFRVGEEISLVDGGGAHVAANGNPYFDLSVCCKDILSATTGASKSYLFYTSRGASYDLNLKFGAHVYAANEPPEDLGLDPTTSDNTPIYNNIQYVEGDCPLGWNCVVKVSPFDNEEHTFYNSHVWSCNTSFSNMISICYEAEQQTNCLSYEGECTEQGWAWIEIALGYSDWVYCSFGEDDIQDPANETGHCCIPGEYASYDPDFNIYTCVSTQNLICGFNESVYDCYLPAQDPDGSPSNLYTEYYFSQPGCVDWVNNVSCCWNVSRYGSSGNYYCDIITTSI